MLILCLQLVSVALYWPNNKQCRRKSKHRGTNINVCISLKSKDSRNNPCVEVEDTLAVELYSNSLNKEVNILYV